MLELLKSEVQGGEDAWSRSGERRHTHTHKEIVETRKSPPKKDWILLGGDSVAIGVASAINTENVVATLSLYEKSRS
ncbi:hypothetical protein JG688_00016978 [Phytophthora aleatoria]|uniref:Uncharacterized protein n=1 Tax=Phytophthora aleatoria TaxID=2496075 RepID=A0A8J5IEP6_9STRA|nr:hypothetical protein JG688_00016978 [Phytophthora aleatoria]